MPFGAQFKRLLCLLQPMQRVDRVKREVDGHQLTITNASCTLTHTIDHTAGRKWHLTRPPHQNSPSVGSSQRGLAHSTRRTAGACYDLPLHCWPTRTCVAAGSGAA